MLSDTIQRLLTRGAVDMGLVSEALDEIYRRSYKHQTQAQRDKVRFERYDVDMGDFKYRVVDPSAKIIRKRYASYVEFDMVSPHRRIRFKRSGLTGKELSIHDIKGRRDIFDYNYLAFIDGKLVDFIHVMPTDSGVGIVFNEENGVDRYGLTKAQFDEMKQAGKTLTIFFLPNNEYGAYTVDTAVLKRYGEYLSLKETGILNALGEEASYISFVNNSDFNFGSVMIDHERSEDIMKFYMDGVQESQKAHLNVFGFRHLLDKFNFQGESNQFVLDYGTKMPIPKENIIVFRKDEYGNTLFAHDIVINHHYSNIYTIEDYTGEELIILVFYAADDSQTEPFFNDLEMYYSIRGYDNIPTLALNYSPEYFEYSIQDFQESEFYPDYDAYKLSKFNAWVDSNPERIRNYLKEKIKDVDGYYIDVSEINLDDRRRYHNRMEINDVYQQEDFGECRSLFVLRNDDTSSYKDIQMFIDGLVYDDYKRYKEGNYEYYYIECSVLNDNSIIEIEEFSKFKTTVLRRITELDKNVEVDITGKSVNTKDIYVIDKITGLNVPSDQYTIGRIHEGVFYELDKDSGEAIESDTLIVSFDHTALNGKYVEVVVDCSRYTYREKVSTDNTNPMYTNKNIGFVPLDSKFLAYHSRRFVYPESYMVINRDIREGSTFSPGVRYDIGDEFKVSYVPYTYTTIYKSDEVPEGGVLNLYGLINKPLDLQWHDIYINGRRLHSKQVEYISPYIIRIKDVLSSKNLIILERNLSREPIYIGSPYKTIIDTLFESDLDFADKLIDLGDITDIEEEIIYEIIDLYGISISEFYYTVILPELRYINPDLKQITEEHKAKVPYLFSDGRNILHVDPSRNPNSTTILRIGGRV